MRRLAIALITTALLGQVSGAQARTPTHVTLIPMANMSAPTSIDFEGGGCDLDPTGNTLTCEFQQVLLNPDKTDAAICRIFTNRYSATFKRQDERRWVSTQGPDGVCGVVAVTTLEHTTDSPTTGVWAAKMDTQKIITNKSASPICNAFTTDPEKLDWKYPRRALPCKFVVGGSLGL